MAKWANRKRKIEPQRPSIFFIAALAIGIALLVWAFVVAVSRPMTPPKKRGQRDGRVAMHSISTFAPSARPLAPSALRAG